MSLQILFLSQSQSKTLRLNSLSEPNPHIEAEILAELSGKILASTIRVGNSFNIEYMFLL